LSKKIPHPLDEGTKNATTCFYAFLHFLLTLLALLAREFARLSLPPPLFLKLSRVLTRSRSKGLPS
jgi:hypothetical protein